MKLLQRLLVPLVVIIVFTLALLIYIFIHTSHVDPIPNMVTYLNQYTNHDIKTLSQNSSRDGSYKIIDTYFDMDGDYRFHYICRHRPHIGIDNGSSCKYYFDGADPDGYSDFFEYFNLQNEPTITKLLQKYSDQNGTRFKITLTSETALYDFFQDYLKLPHVADFYKVCYERQHQPDYFEFEHTCNENSLRLASDPTVTIFQWAVDHNIKPTN